MIKRQILSVLKNRLFKNKALIIVGARQVGKTTLVRMLAEDSGNAFVYFNCDEPDIRAMLTNPTSTELQQLIGRNKLVIVDEAQRIPNMGLSAKLIVDNIPEIQLILTGSSSIELQSEINEPLTGRKFEFSLYPLSFSEMVSHTSLLEERRLLERRMIFGSYPEIVNNPGEEEFRLKDLNNSYLFKDIYSQYSLKKPQLLDKLTQMLALQIGSEVSLNELSNSLGIDKNTVVRYIDLLEKANVIFSLSSYSRNLRNELKKSRKIYYWDMGIRNAIIKNFSPLELRSDTGAMWENFVISERLKFLNNTSKNCNVYFWRDKQKREIDYIEEEGGILNTFEIKWNPKTKAKLPVSFSNAYPESKFNLITSDNYWQYMINELGKL